MTDEIPYTVGLIITDKQMKGNDGNLVSFKESAQVSGKSEKEARVYAKYLAGTIWETSRYTIEVESCEIRK